MALQPKHRKSAIPRHVQRKVQLSLTYLILSLLIVTFAVGVYKGGVHLADLNPQKTTIKDLPAALALSLLRMTISYFACIVFSFILGLLAARTKVGERIIIPLIDILQSIPVVGFFPAAVGFFVAISHGHRIGVEMAACFLIFTSQAWNMAFSIYESTKTIPTENLDAVESFGVNGVKRFWILYAPAAVPRLVYNSMLSWSNGWYFLVACEIITVGPLSYQLPGIGSFLQRAADQNQVPLIIWGLVALTSLILAMDVLIWKPAMQWAVKFKQTYTTSGADDEGSSVSYKTPIVNRSMRKLAAYQLPFNKLIKNLTIPLVFIFKEIALPLLWDLPYALVLAIGDWYRETIFKRIIDPLFSKTKWLTHLTLGILGAAIGIRCAIILFHWLRPPWPAIAREIPLAVLASTGRLLIALGISFLWVIPVIYFTWNRPKIRSVLTTIAQIGASLPAVALFPLFIVIAVKKFGAGMETASIFLLLTGMQWYLLFNGLSGAASIPSDLTEVASGFGVKGWLIWKKLVSPSIRPALVTGAITAWGGGWNALVVSEYISYQNNILKVKGIGALLNHAVFDLGDNRSISLCIAGMVVWIIFLNTVFWRPLYQNTAERYRLEG